MSRNSTSIDIRDVSRVSQEKYAKHDVRDAISPFMISVIFVAVYVILVTGAVTTTFLTKYLHTNDREYGIIMSGIHIGVIGTLIGTYMVARSGRTKPYFIPGVIIGRSLYIVLAIILLVFPPVQSGEHPTTLIYVTTIIIVVSFIINNFGNAGWMTWMADLIPRSIAGRLFGTRAQLSFFLQLIIGLSAPFIINIFHHSRYVYAAVFAFGGICGVLDIMIHRKIREVKREIPHPLPSIANMLLTPWKDDFFKRIALYFFVSSIGLALMGVFTWRYCYKAMAENGLEITFNMANLLISIIPIICMIVAAPIWGKAIDIFGSKITLRSAILAHSVMPLCWAFINVHLIDKSLILVWLCFVAVLSGITWPGIDQSSIFIQMKLFPNKLKVAFITSSVLCGSGGAFIGLNLSGYLAGEYADILPNISFLSWMSEYQLLFILAALVRFVSYLYLKYFVTFPSDKENIVIEYTIYKYVFSNICDTIFYIFRPFKDIINYSKSR